MTLPMANKILTHAKLFISSRASVQLNKLLQKRSASTKSESEPKKTTLYDLHVQHKGKLVDFAEYLLPVQYNNLSISASHLHTRQNASIFDVSHMLQTYVRGKDAIDCFESICTADIKGLEQNSGTLTVFTNSNGGIFDDLIVSKVSDELLYVVSNAACRSQDIGIIQESVVSKKHLFVFLLFDYQKLKISYIFVDWHFRIDSKNLEKMFPLSFLTVINAL